MIIFFKKISKTIGPIQKENNSKLQSSHDLRQSPGKQFLAAEFTLLFVLNTITCSKTNRILNGIVALPVYINFQYFIMV